MSHLMRQKAGSDPAIIAGLMVLKTEMGHVITQGEQKVVLAVVTRAVERAGFGHQSLVFIDGLLGHLQRGIAIGSDVNKVLNWPFRGKWNAAEVFAGEHWRVN